MRHRCPKTQASFVAVFEEVVLAAQHTSVSQVLLPVLPVLPALTSLVKMSPLSESPYWFLAKEMKRRTNWHIPHSAK